MNKIKTISKPIFQENIIDIPLYPCKLGILICDDIEKINSILGTEYEEIKTGLATAHDLTFYITLNPNNPEFKLTHGVIAHEALHIVNLIFDRLDVFYSFDNDEHAAYLLMWIVDVVHEYYEKVSQNELKIK